MKMYVSDGLFESISKFTPVSWIAKYKDIFGNPRQTKISGRTKEEAVKSFMDELADFAKYHRNIVDMDTITIHEE